MRRLETTDAEFHLIKLLVTDIVNNPSLYEMTMVAIAKELASKLVVEIAADPSVDKIADNICEALASWLPEPLHQMAYEDAARAAMQTALK